MCQQDSHLIGRCRDAWSCMYKREGAVELRVLTTNTTVLLRSKQAIHTTATAKHASMHTTKQASKQASKQACNTHYPYPIQGCH